MELNLNDKIALVTGGSKGIGFGIAEFLASEGASVILLARSGVDLERAKANITANGGTVLKLIKADLSDQRIEDIIKSQITPHDMYPNILINNSGGPPIGNFLEHDIENWYKYVDQNLFSTIRLTKLFSKNMIENKWGRIINITSTNAIEPSSEMVISSTLRSAISAYSKSVSLTLAQTGVTINTICPGGVSTDRLLNLIKSKSERDNVTEKKALSAAQNSIPMGRFAKPEELGSLVSFLCSQHADYLTGRVYCFDGGLVKGF